MRKGKCWSEEKAVQFPQSYLQQLAANNEERSPADGLRALIIEYMDENGDSVIREDRWKTELLRAVNQKAKADGMAMTAASIQAMVGEMAALRAVVERQATEMAELRAAIANIDLLLPEQECPNLPILPVAESVRHATPKLSPDAGAAAVPPQQSHTCGPSAAGGVKLKFAGVASSTPGAAGSGPPGQRATAVGAPLNHCARIAFGLRSRIAHAQLCRAHRPPLAAAFTRRLAP
eukprot:7380918-Prymnesium_polylepis.1